MKQLGFTLIELLITIAIAAVLLSIAMPQYNEQVQRGRRTDALETIQVIMDAQERFFASNAKYTDNLSVLGFSTKTSGGYYSLKAGACSGKTLVECVEITATPIGSQASDGSIIFNSSGKRERDGHPL